MNDEPMGVRRYEQDTPRIENGHMIPTCPSCGAEDSVSFNIVISAEDWAEPINPWRVKVDDAPSYPKFKDLRRGDEQWGDSIEDINSVQCTECQHEGKPGEWFGQGQLPKLQAALRNVQTK